MQAAIENFTARRDPPLHVADPRLLQVSTALLGEGSFGKVYFATYGGREVAVKILQVSPSDPPEALSNFRKEAELLQRLSHPNIVRYFGFLERTGVERTGGGPWFGGGGTKEYLIVEELAEGGCLAASALRSSGAAPLPPDASRRIALGVAHGLRYLHGLKDPVAHCDINLDNIQLDKEGNALVADFGLARAVAGTLPRTYSTGTARSAGMPWGTMQYMAPENMDDKSKYYRKTPSDLYSFAMLLFALVTGRAPWEGRNMGEIAMAVNAGLRPELPKGLDGALARLITCCWDQDPSRRPTATALVGMLEDLAWGRAGVSRITLSAAWVAKLQEARRQAGGAVPTAPPPPQGAVGQEGGHDPAWGGGGGAV